MSLWNGGAINGSQLTINPPENLEPDTEYYVEIADSAITDSFLRPYPQWATFRLRTTLPNDRWEDLRSRSPVPNIADPPNETQKR